MQKKLMSALVVAALAALPSLSQADGQELYMKYCKKCHGDAGAGDTPMGKKFAIKDYTMAEAQANVTDEQIAAAIKDGLTDESGKKVMLAFGNKLSEEGVGELVAYFRTLAAK